MSAPGIIDMYLYRVNLRLNVPSSYLYILIGRNLLMVTKFCNFVSNFIGFPEEILWIMGLNG